MVKRSGFHKEVVQSLLQSVSVLCIKGYQSLRPILDQLNIVVFGYASPCKHSPTCSEFTKEAILKYGTMRGIVLGVKRIISCR